MVDFKIYFQDFLQNQNKNLQSWKRLESIVIQACQAIIVYSKSKSGPEDNINSNTANYNEGGDLMRVLGLNRLIKFYRDRVEMPEFAEKYAAELSDFYSGKVIARNSCNSQTIRLATESEIAESLMIFDPYNHQIIDLLLA